MILEEAQALTSAVMEQVAPLCIRAEPTGVVRRKWDCDIKHIELIAIPDHRDLAKLRALRDVVNRRWGNPRSGEFPSKHTSIRSAAPIDIYWVNRDTWGYMQFFRTGSVDFVLRALRYWKNKLGGSHSEGHLYNPSGDLVPTPEEQDVFNALQCKFIDPEKRR